MLGTLFTTQQKQI